MHPPTSAKPKPPQNRRTSSQLNKSVITDSNSSITTNNNSNNSNSTIEFPSIPQKSLASSSITKCKPPESPPIHYYDTLISSSPNSPSEGRSSLISTNSNSEIGVNNNNKSKTSAIGPNFVDNSLNLKLNEDNQPFQGGRSRALSIKTRDSLARSYGPSEAELNVPTLNRETLDAKNKLELVELVETADKVITEAQRERDMAARVGQSLFEENLSLKAQLESMSLDASKSLRHRNSELRDHPTPSPHPLRHSRNPSFNSTFTPTTSSKLHRNPSWGSNLSTSPTTPIRTSDHRHRLSSTTSINSLFSSPLKINLASITSPEQLGNLNKENYALTLKVTELEEEKDEAERDGKRRIRKLEKDLLALRLELERVEERNVVLEEKTSILNSSEIGGKRLSRPNSRDDLLSSFKIQEDSTPTFNRIINHTIPSTPSPLGTTDLNSPFGKAFPPQSIRDPSAFSHRRQPGTPGENFLPHQSLFDSFSSPILPSHATIVPTTATIHAKEEMVDSLVNQLKLKIEELERTNEVIEEEQEMLKMKLERAQKAQRDAEEESRKIYEELLESQEEVNQLVWKDEPNLIGWTQTGDGSPTRNRNRTNLSNSPESFRRRRKGKSRQSLESIQHTRTLGSELGSNWDEERSSCSSSCSEFSDYEDDDNDSTSAPTTFSPNHLQDEQDSDSGYLNTSSNLFERGSLRYSGAPDNEEYESFSQVVNDLPAKWENEDTFNLNTFTGTNNNHHCRRRSSNFKTVRSIGWNEERDLAEESEHDDLRRTIRGKGREIDSEKWENSNYPQEEEEEELNFSRMGTGEYGSRRRERERSVSQNALGNRRSESLRNRRQFNSSTTTNTTNDSRRSEKLTRREMALERLGLESPNSINNRYRYHEFQEGDEIEGRKEEEEFEEEEMSEYELIDGTKVRKGTYWPMTLRARYAPHMIGIRFVDTTISTVITVITYIRFFMILAFALFFALYQGPQKTLGLVDAKRRLQ